VVISVLSEEQVWWFSVEERGDVLMLSEYPVWWSGPEGRREGRGPLRYFIQSLPIGFCCV